MRDEARCQEVSTPAGMVEWVVVLFSCCQRFLAGIIGARAPWRGVVKGLFHRKPSLTMSNSPHVVIFYYNAKGFGLSVDGLNSLNICTTAALPSRRGTARYSMVHLLTGICHWQAYNLQIHGDVVSKQASRLHTLSHERDTRYLAMDIFPFHDKGQLRPKEPNL
jgi:hypothetical protein